MTRVAEPSIGDSHSRLDGLAIRDAARLLRRLNQLLGAPSDKDRPDRHSARHAVEFREALLPLVAQLPAREQQILTMRFFGSQTQRQTAQHLGISPMHVSRLLARCLAQLRVGLTA